MGEAGARNVRQGAGDAFPPGDQAETGQIAERKDLGGAANGEWLEWLGTKQEERDQFLVADGLHPRVKFGRQTDRSIVPGTPGPGQSHDRGQIGQAVAAGFALQKGAVRGFTYLLGQRDHNWGKMDEDGKTQPSD